MTFGTFSRVRKYFPQWTASYSAVAQFLNKRVEKQRCYRKMVGRTGQESKFIYTQLPEP